MFPSGSSENNWEWHSPGRNTYGTSGIATYFVYNGIGGWFCPHCINHPFHLRSMGSYSSVPPTPYHVRNHQSICTGLQHPMHPFFFGQHQSVPPTQYPPFSHPEESIHGPHHNFEPSPEAQSVAPTTECPRASSAVSITTERENTTFKTNDISHPENQNTTVDGQLLEFCYDVHLPKTYEGFMLILGETNRSDYTAKFLGFFCHSNGEKTFAAEKSVIRNIGDIIVAVNQSNIFGKSVIEVDGMIRCCKSSVNLNLVDVESLAKSQTGCIPEKKDEMQPIPPNASKSENTFARKLNSTSTVSDKSSCFSATQSNMEQTMMSCEAKLVYTKAVAAPNYVSPTRLSSSMKPVNGEKNPPSKYVSQQKGLNHTKKSQDFCLHTGKSISEVNETHLIKDFVPNNRQHVCSPTPLRSERASVLEDKSSFQSTAHNASLDKSTFADQLLGISISTASDNNDCISSIEEPPKLPVAFKDSTKPSDIGFPEILDGWDVYDASKHNSWLRGRVLESRVEKGSYSYLVRFYGYSTAKNKWVDHTKIFPVFKIQRGDRVFAYWKDQRDQAFPGKIIRSRKRMKGGKNLRGSYLYDVEFDDGDVEHNIPEDRVLPENVRFSSFFVPF